MKLSTMLTIASRVASKKYAHDEECGCDLTPEQEAKLPRADKELNKQIPPDYLKEKFSTDQRGTFVWVKPIFEHLESSIVKAAKTLGIDKDNLSSKISSQIETGYLSYLSDAEWAVVANTDSWSIQSKDEAELVALLRGKDKSLESILDIMGTGSALPAPVILSASDFNDRPYLIDGNIRLIACRILGIRPEVFLVSI